MTTHNLQLAAAPFTAIKSGQRTIESRIYDEKRRLIQLRDSLVLTDRENPKETVTATVIGLLVYKTFHDLFSHNEPTKFGGPSVEWLENQISEFYSVADQNENGVIGIEFILS